MKNKILIQAWGVYKNEGNYYIEYSHAIYLRTLSKKYKEIFMICPTYYINKEQTNKYSMLSNIAIFELPTFSSYLNSYKNFYHYIRLYKKIKNNNFDTIYSRFPSPFGWLQMFYFKKNRVVHFVGNPIDTILKNKNINPIFRYIKVAFFIPEYLMFILSCYSADKVFSNGHHIANNLSKFKVNVKPVVSSTLINSDFYISEGLINSDECVKLIYVGYLRKAKGVEVLIDAVDILNIQFPRKFSLTIIGTGEDKKYLEDKAKKLETVVNFLGHIDSRDILNSTLREHDIFCFASLSEGSPRVVLEAIANGLIVITTPVGSLPYIFKDYEDVLYFNFNDKYTLAEKIIELCGNTELQKNLKLNSFNKVQNFKIDNFIKEVFNA